MNVKYEIRIGLLRTAWIEDNIAFHDYFLEFPLARNHVIGQISGVGLVY